MRKLIQLLLIFTFVHGTSITSAWAGNTSAKPATSSSSSGTTEACVNAPQGAREVSSHVINKALEQAQDPLTKSFAYTNPALCQPTSAATRASAGVIRATRKSLKVGQIKEDCIKASLKREVSGTGYSCQKGSPRVLDTSKSVPCINEKTFNFIHHSVNQALTCFASFTEPIDARFILKKINNETGFNFYLGGNGGVGLSQVTSDPINELAGYWGQIPVRNSKGKITHKEKKFIPGNAHSTLENLMSSKDPSCSPFQKIIESDLNNPPPSPGNSRNYCSWLGVGEGVGRNLVYSLGYYSYSRDHFIKESLREVAPKLTNNPEIVNNLTLVAYGPGGPAQAKALIHKLRLSNSSKPSVVLKQIDKHSEYVHQTNAKMQELIDKLKSSGSKLSPDLGGSACVSH